VKRSYFKPKTYYKIPKGATFGLRRTPLSKKGKSDTALCKDRIQQLVRAIVIKRDGGCILRNKRFCNDPVLQADHLISRSNSATYADTRLIVCVCRSCHAWKSCGSNLRKNEYDRLVKTILPPERVALWERAEEDFSSHKTSKVDWVMEELCLQAELKRYPQVDT
jgi:hypothetical protein